MQSNMRKARTEHCFTGATATTATPFDVVIAVCECRRRDKFQLF